MLLAALFYIPSAIQELHSARLMTQPEKKMTGEDMPSKLRAF
jgi:hypothetical protein